MKAREFCYWLQGHLELAGPASSLDARQLELVGRHLKMVRINDAGVGGMAGAFCGWLEGTIDACLGFEPPAGFSAAKRAQTQAKLADVFRGEIDPSYPKDQWEALVAAHQGLPDPAPKPQAAYLTGASQPPHSGMSLNPNESSHLVRC